MPDLIVNWLHHGIFLMLFLFAIAELGTTANNASLNLAQKYSNSSELARQQQKHTVESFLSNKIADTFGYNIVLLLKLTPFPLI